MGLVATLGALQVAAQTYAQILGELGQGTAPHCPACSLPCWHLALQPYATHLFQRSPIKQPSCPCSVPGHWRVRGHCHCAAHQDHLPAANGALRTLWLAGWAAHACLAIAGSLCGAWHPQSVHQICASVAGPAPIPALTPCPTPALTPPSPSPGGRVPLAGGPGRRLHLHLILPGGRCGWDRGLLRWLGCAGRVLLPPSVCTTLNCAPWRAADPHEMDGVHMTTTILVCLCCIWLLRVAKPVVAQSCCLSATSTHTVRVLCLLPSLTRAIFLPRCRAPLSAPSP